MTITHSACVLTVQGYPPIVMSAGSNISAANDGFTPSGSTGAAGSPGASASGGEGTLTYLWELVGAVADDGPFNPTDETVLNAFWPSIVANDSSTVVSETWRLTVSDTVGQSESDTITVTYTWTNLS